MKRSVSAIVPVKNGAAFLAAALASILEQSRPPDEVIVVDDGSEDASADIARSFPGVSCHVIPPSGQAAALNRGVALAAGTHLAFLDADDEWARQKLELQLSRFAADPELDAVFGRAEQFVEQAGRVIRRLPPIVAHLPSAMLIKREAWDRVGSFDVSLRLGMVVEWYARARDAGLREETLEAVVYRRRIHGTNLGLVHASERGEYAAMLKRVLDRRRAEQGS